MSKSGTGFQPVILRLGAAATRNATFPMNLPRLIARRLRALFRREKLDAEMAEEMRAHLEMQAERNRAAMYSRWSCGRE